MGSSSAPPGCGVGLFQFQEYDSIADVQQNIRLIGQVVGEEARAEALVAAMQAVLQTLEEQLRPMELAPACCTGARTAIRPAALTSMDDLITYAGGENLAATYGLIGPANLSAEQVLAMDPQVIVRAVSTKMKRVGIPPLMHPALQGTDAVQHARVYTIPSRYLVTISQCIVDGVEAFARVLHGTALGPGAAMKPQGVPAWASVALLGGLLGLVGVAAWRSAVSSSFEQTIAILLHQPVDRRDDLWTPMQATIILQVRFPQS